MALLDHNGECEFPIAKEKVYEALCQAIPTISGMKLESADKLLGRIMVKTGVSLFSWGENIPIQLLEVSRIKQEFRLLLHLKQVLCLAVLLTWGKTVKILKIFYRLRLKSYRKICNIIQFKSNVQQ